MMDKAIDDETVVDIQTRDYILCEEVKEDNFRVYELIHEANERLVLETGEDDLPEDYGEYDDDEDLKTDENGNLLSFDEYIEREEEKEREKEAEEEKEAERMQSDRTRLMMVRKHMYLFP